MNILRPQWVKWQNDIVHAPAAYLHEVSYLLADLRVEDSAHRR